MCYTLNSVLEKPKFFILLQVSNLLMSFFRVSVIYKNDCIFFFQPTPHNGSIQLAPGYEVMQACLEQLSSYALCLYMLSTYIYVYYFFTD